MKNLIIIGAGALGREFLAIAEASIACQPCFTIKGFLDPEPTALDGFGINFPILGSDAEYEPTRNDRFVIAIGEPKTRSEAASRLQNRGAIFTKLIHPTAQVISGAKLSAGCVLAQFTLAAANCRLGAHTFLNTHVVIGHDTIIGDSCVISPGAKISGQCALADEVFVGSNAVITPGRSVGSRSRIAAGSVVYKNVKKNTLAIGNPAKNRALLKRG